MTTKIIISALIFLTVISCNNSRTTNNQNQDTPKALDENKSVSELVSSRSYDDLVENLYDELVSKTSDLKRLENNINDLNTSERDSTEAFQKFNGKNKSYYNAADHHIEGITDSLIRDKMKSVIAGSLNKYNSLIAKHNDLLKTIQEKDITIADLHTVLKISVTLPLIEKFQSVNAPSTKSLEGFIDRQNEAIKLSDSLLKR